MSIPKKISICESLPRDGLQEIQQFIPTDKKIDVIKMIIDSGFKSIDALSFAHPKWVPQFADSEEVAEKILGYAEAHGVGIIASALNKRAVERGRAAGVRNLCWCASVSEQHSLRNTNKSIPDTYEETDYVLTNYADDNTEFHMSIMCALGNPFGEPLNIDLILKYAELAMSKNVAMISLSDTAGLGDPDTVHKVVHRVKDYVPFERLCLHLHDSQGMGLASTLAGLEEGVINYSSSLGGQGGCPFAPGSKGNIATEDLLNMCEKMGIETGINANNALALSKTIGEFLNIPMQSAMLSYSKCCRL